MDVNKMCWSEIDWNNMEMPRIRFETWNLLSAINIIVIRCSPRRARIHEGSPNEIIDCKVEIHPPWLFMPDCWNHPWNYLSLKSFDGVHGEDTSLYPRTYFWHKKILHAFRLKYPWRKFFWQLRLEKQFDESNHKLHVFIVFFSLFYSCLASCYIWFFIIFC